jgi:hypothetical protein
MELKCFAMFVELKLAWNKWNFFFFAMFVPILSDVSEETELLLLGRTCDSATAWRHRLVIFTDRTYKHNKRAHVSAARVSPPLIPSPVIPSDWPCAAPHRRARPCRSCTESASALPDPWPTPATPAYPPPPHAPGYRSTQHGRSSSARPRSPARRARTAGSSPAT